MSPRIGINAYAEYPVRSIASIHTPRLTRRRLKCFPLTNRLTAMTVMAAPNEKCSSIIKSPDRYIGGKSETAMRARLFDTEVTTSASAREIPNRAM